MRRFLLELASESGKCAPSSVLRRLAWNWQAASLVNLPAVDLAAGGVGLEVSAA